MTEDEVKYIIFRALNKTAPEAEPSELSANDNICEKLAMDSFDNLQFLLALEEQLGLIIPEQDYGQTTSLKDLTNYILSKQK